MQIKQLYSFLDKLSPFSSQESWDNSGLIVGSLEDDIDRVYISLDLDLQMLDKIEPNSLIITHHPLIFKPLKSINYDSYSTKLLKILIQKNIKLLSLHTNFDKSHLNEYVTKDILGFKDAYSDEFFMYSECNMTFDELYNLVSNKLKLNNPQAVLSNNAHQSKIIKKIAITTGAGMSLLPFVKCDCFLTGDIKYHDAMEAKERGISLIDISHYGSEVYFSDIMSKIIDEFLNFYNIKAIISNSKNPFLHLKGE